MNVFAIPQLSDNYCYCVFKAKETGCCLFDVSEDAKVIAFLKLANLKPNAIFSTHKHDDHCAGNAGIKKAYPDIKIYGHKIDSVPECTHFIEDNCLAEEGGLKIKAMHTPCHTMGHLVYYIESSGKSCGCSEIKVDKAYGYENIEKAVFTGDTLFIGGCGRFFEGTAKDMVYSLNKIAQLHDNTNVFCGHEYTIANLEFALKVDKDNKEIVDALTEAKKNRDIGKPSVPSTIKREKLINIFMRTHESKILELCHTKDQTECMAVLREAKNKNKF